MVSPKNSSGTITSTEVRTLLRAAATSLSAREEKALRMRTGAALPKNQPLPRRGQTNPDARAELLSLEAELVQKLAARAAAAKPARKAEAKAAPAARSTTRTKEKEKIIRALKRLK
jgi:hypothetical protein